MRGMDVETGIILAAVWSVFAYMAASFDSMFIIAFFTTALLLFLSGSLMKARGAVLFTAFAAGLLLTISGAGIEKLVMFSFVGIVFELLRSANQKPFEGAMAATVLLPILMWALSGAALSLLIATSDLMIVALLAGAAGTGLGTLIWGRIEHSAAVIRFQCAGSARSERELNRLMKKEKHFNRGRQ